MQEIADSRSSLEQGIFCKFLWINEYESQISIRNNYNRYYNIVFMPVCFSGLQPADRFRQGLRGRMWGRVREVPGTEPRFHTLKPLLEIVFETVS